MKRIFVLVEGQTEERFIKDIMSPFFETKDILIVPTIVNTKIVKSGPNFKGGLRSYDAVKNDLIKLFNDSDVVAITTMFDFYGLPADFPEANNFGENETCYQKVKKIEDAFMLDIGKDRFIPYIQIHEFEGLLFTSPDIISRTINDINTKDELQKIRNSVSSPEEINQGRETAPSKRLLKLCPYYNKIVYGSMIANRIGLETIRKECPHFDEWINKLLLF